MSKPRTIHTPESLQANTDEYGDCLLWRGYLCNKAPQVHHEGGMIAVRKLILMLRGVEIFGSYFPSNCGEPSCVCEDHIIQRTQHQQAKAMAKKSSTGIGKIKRVTAIKKWRRENPIKLTMEQARKIRYDPRPAPAVAAEEGISKSMVSKIRSGRYWVETSNPFAGLGGRP